MSAHPSGGLRIRDLRKSYGTVSVLKGVNLDFAPGEVHALLGANGAGKSTLLGCLSGAVAPTSGTIHAGGKEHTGFTPRSAFEAGTAIIYQHFQLAETLTVADNVFLGVELRTPLGTIRRRDQELATQAILERLDVPLDPRTGVDTLTVGQQQIVEIARALRRDPEILILDEPTAALGRHEVEALLALVRRLAHEHGIAVVFVTHILSEVMAVADRVSILRGGTLLWSRDREDVELGDLVAGISPDRIDSATDTARQLGEELVRLDGLVTSYCGPIDLSIAAGEIVGVFALLGGGRTNLLETLAGARPVSAGQVTIGGVPARIGRVADAMRSGIALVASDRPHQSLFGRLSALENMLMPHYRRLSHGLRHPPRENQIFNDVARRVQLSPRSATTEASAFSGGNAQKIVVGRWLAGLDDVRLLLLDEPTQGVDIGSRAQIYELLRGYVGAQTRSVLFATSDPDEAIALADRIVVLVDGHIEAVVAPSIGEHALLALAQSVDISKAHS
ncbi:sugar ABC transporter ATP-binding protein [Microbacterium trichothecenolyticum]|uniref:Sugar ABC transporter ATP-binding protein n=1 Tax=Microbacterium ureisolvens TaxID=2781186 RepID=A0ABS7I3Y2_9MICO|nr:MULTISPECIES: sugar ABC transporter ATP-binding protein [Microbacterium]MBW9111978.1 sugar ABC transporter ATP-binding protein [Microbacterium ureisolvens]MBW9122413.1 sugar ABC transporter ATP-binding protein [Microbacterium trichothecenolyticum]